MRSLRRIRAEHSCGGTAAAVTARGWSNIASIRCEDKQSVAQLLFSPYSSAHLCHRFYSPTSLRPLSRFPPFEVDLFLCTTINNKPLTSHSKTEARQGQRGCGGGGARGDDEEEGRGGEGGAGLPLVSGVMSFSKCLLHLTGTISLRRAPDGCGTGTGTVGGHDV